jgi:hypothetical protein
METLKVKLTFTEEILGSANNDPHIHEKFIASKSEDSKKTAEEVEAVSTEEKIEEQKTIFPKMADGTPFIYDYQIKGFFKDASGILRTVPKTLSSKVKAYKKYIDGRIFVEPRQIPFVFGEPYADGKYISSCQRPLRASTPQGERNSLANSESIKAGASIEFEVKCLNEEDIDWVKELLEYGKLRGLGQWRNSGKGRFKVEYLEK